MIKFYKATQADKALLDRWWHSPHIQEFWDMSSEMWQNVENYLTGKKDLYDYWIGMQDEIPFCLVISSDAHDGESKGFPSDQPKGTWTLDFMIGEPTFLGKGLSHIALIAFTSVKRDGVNHYVIDPSIENKKAIHVYEKAGFLVVGEHIPTKGPFKGIRHKIMRLIPQISSIFFLSLTLV